MSRSLRTTTLIVCTLLWLTGCIWIVLHYFFSIDTVFGSGPNPWESLTIRIHGVIAIATVFMLGWISARHIVEAWNVRRMHVSGIVLSSVCALQVLSGYALYYLPDALLQSSVGVVHQVIGGAAIVFALAHWHRASRRRSKSIAAAVPPQPTIDIERRLT
jgi:hypothetical protein